MCKLPLYTRKQNLLPELCVPFVFCLLLKTEGGRGRLLSTVSLPNAHSGLDWARPKLQAWSLIAVSHVGGKDLIT